MDITSYVISSAVAMSQARIEQAISLSTIKKALDLQETQGMALVEMMNSVPRFDRLMDLYA